MDESALRNKGRWPKHGEKEPYQTVSDGQNTLKGKRDVGHRFEVMQVPRKMQLMEVLDLGCNLGEICRECMRRQALKAWGVDCRSNYLELAKGLGSEVQYIKADLNNDIDIDNLIEKFYAIRLDYIFCLSIIKHVKKKMLGKLLRRLSWLYVLFEGHATYYNRESDMSEFCEKFRIPCEIEYLGRTTDRKERLVWRLKRISQS